MPTIKIPIWIKSDKVIYIASPSFRKIGGYFFPPSKIKRGLRRLPYLVTPSSSLYQKMTIFTSNAHAFSRSRHGSYFLRKSPPLKPWQWNLFLNFRLRRRKQVKSTRGYSFVTYSLYRKRMAVLIIPLHSRLGCPLETGELRLTSSPWEQKTHFLYIILDNCCT